LLQDALVSSLKNIATRFRIESIRGSRSIPRPIAW